MMLLRMHQYPRALRLSRLRANGHHCLRPLSAIDILELFKHDLDLLAVGRVHRDKVKTLEYRRQCLPLGSISR